ncbi:MAG: hypothetical protein ABUT39_09650, partial [Acidobacteriota bacterium]
MDRKAALILGLLAALNAPSAARAQEGDPYTLKAMEEFNGDLKALWMDVRIEQVEILTRSHGRASSRIHRQPFRWVANDARRHAEGTSLTYLIDLGDSSASALDAEAVEASIDRATATCAAATCMKSTPLR